LLPTAVVNRAPADPMATTRPGNGTADPGAGPRLFRAARGGILHESRYGRTWHRELLDSVRAEDMPPGILSDCDG